MARHKLHRSTYVESSDKLQIYGAANNAEKITENILA
jgi:hypothetical protein